MLLTSDQSAVLLDIARGAIRAALRGENLSSIPDADRLLLQPAGCFVSLHEIQTHRLRGCMGRIDSNEPLAAVVQQVAADVLNDPRFTNRPVRLDELSNLDMEISILSPLAAATTPLDFDLMEDGIYLTIGDRRGCFLPQVARQTGWTKEQLLDRLCAEKLDLPPKAWLQSNAQLQRFKVVIVGPEAFGHTPKTPT